MENLNRNCQVFPAEHTFHGWYVMGPMCIFFSFLARRTSPKRGTAHSLHHLYTWPTVPEFLEVPGRLFVCLCVLFFSSFHSSTEYKNCAKLYKSGKRIGGVYKINPDGAGPDFEVLKCDQTPAGGGWTVA